MGLNSMIDKHQIGKKTIDFWNRYISKRGQRNADMPPPLTGRMYQGGPSRGIPEDIGYEVHKGSPVGRFGRPSRARFITRIKR